MTRHDKFPALLSGEKDHHEEVCVITEVKVNEMNASVASPPTQLPFSYALISMPIKSSQGNLFVSIRQPPHLSVRFASRMTSLRHSDTVLRLLPSITKVEGFI
ncbi:hypothetical protein NXS19_004109 [Fusarium pseudograminearum]|nr:hypothetical protein NXS19_004109 [Fusarium pseudograminearum]